MVWHPDHLFQVWCPVGVHKRVVDALRESIGDEVRDHESYSKRQTEVVFPRQLEDDNRCAHGACHPRRECRGPDQRELPRLSGMGGVKGQGVGTETAVGVGVDWVVVVAAIVGANSCVLQPGKFGMTSRWCPVR